MSAKKDSQRSKKHIRPEANSRQSLQSRNADSDESFMDVDNQDAEDEKENASHSYSSRRLSKDGKPRHSRGHQNESGSPGEELTESMDSMALNRRYSKGAIREYVALDETIMNNSDGAGVTGSNAHNGQFERMTGKTGSAETKPTQTSKVDNKKGKGSNNCAGNTVYNETESLRNNHGINYTDSSKTSLHRTFQGCKPVDSRRGSKSGNRISKNQGGGSEGTGKCASRSSNSENSSPDLSKTTRTRRNINTSPCMRRNSQSSSRSGVSRSPSRHADSRSPIKGTNSRSPIRDANSRASVKSTNSSAPVKGVDSRSPSRGTDSSSSSRGADNRSPSRGADSSSPSRGAGSRNHSRSTDSRSSIGSGASRRSSSIGTSINHIRAADSRSSSSSAYSKSPRRSGDSRSRDSRSRDSRSRDGISSVSHVEKSHKRTPAMGICPSASEAGQRALKKHDSVKKRTKNIETKQESSDTDEDSKQSKSKERKISSSSKNRSRKKKDDKYTKDSSKERGQKGKNRKQERKRSSSRKTQSGKDASSSSKKESSKQKEKKKYRNRSTDKKKQDHSDSEEEGTNANSSARNSSEALSTKSRIQHKWQYEDDFGWTTYGQIPSTKNCSGAKAFTSDEIELHYLNDEEKHPLVLRVNNVNFLLNFQTMTQTNEKTHSRRKIRRIMKNNMDDHSASGRANHTRNYSEGVYNALDYRASPDPTSYACVSNRYSASNNIPTARSNNYDKHRSTDTLANDSSVKHVWQFEDEHGKWITYGKSNSIFDRTKATTSDDIEEVYAKDRSKAIMRIHSKYDKYILNFRTLTQTNEATQSQKRVRRVPEQATNTSLVEKVKPLAGSLLGSGKEITFEWQFQDEHGAWITYGQANSAGMSHCTTTVTSDDIEKFFNSSPRKVMMTIKSIHNDYVLDFVAMTQTNEKTSVQRPIRRIPKFSRENKPPNSFPSTGYGGGHFTSGQGGDYNHASGAGNIRSSVGGHGGGYNYSVGAGNIPNTHNGAGGRGGGYDYSVGAGNIPNTHKGAGGRGGGYDYSVGAGNIQNTHNSAGGRGGGYNHYNVSYSSPGYSPFPILFKWQFMDEKGLWITYGQSSSTGFNSGKTIASSDDIEQHYLITMGHQPLEIRSSTNVYMLDFVHMVQFNTATKVRKPIRRVHLNYRD